MEGVAFDLAAMGELMGAMMDALMAALMAALMGSVVGSVVGRETQPARMPAAQVSTSKTILRRLYWYLGLTDDPAANKVKSIMSFANFWPGEAHNTACVDRGQCRAQGAPDCMTKICFVFLPVFAGRWAPTLRLPDRVLSGG